MTDLFIKDLSRDDHLAKNASGDIDMILSPKDGSLVVVCQEEGVHVCGYCLEQFESTPDSPKRAVEWNPGGFGTRMLLHASCVSPVKSYPRNLIVDRERGHQARRLLTKATKGMPTP
jgi:hypothetical protein